MDYCKAVETPLFQDLYLATDKSEELKHRTPYRQSTGSILRFHNIVRADIAFALSYLSQSLHKPTKLLGKGMKRIVWYLDGTKSLAIVYYGTKYEGIYNFSDADKGRKRLVRMSVPGIVFTHAGGATF